MATTVIGPSRLRRMDGYVKAQKTDDRDAEAIAEAATRPTMRFVSLKSEAQLDLQILQA